MLTVSPVVGGQPAADRTGLLHDVQPGGRRAGQAQHAHAEAVLAAVLGLLDQPALLEGRDQPERGALVHADLAGDRGDAGLAGAGQDVEDGQRPLDRLHAGRTPVLAALIARYASAALLRIADSVVHTRNWSRGAMTDAPRDHPEYVLTIVCPDRPGHRVRGRRAS